MSAGLFRPEDERDNCGFGLIAHMEGEASHRLLSTAIESLTCMTHRGGIAADGKTGDGCGLLMQKPDSFLRAEAKRLFEADLGEFYGIGQAFLSQNESDAAAARSAVEWALEEEGLGLLGWREVPIDPSVCGELALESMPRIEQFFVTCGEHLSEEDLNTRLYIARRRA